MIFDFSFISADEYNPAELLFEQIPEHYLFDEKGNYCYATNFSDSENLPAQLIHFLFAANGTGKPVYKNSKGYILDLTHLRPYLITYNQMELAYPDWLAMTNRNNTMTEFGILLDFRGFAEQGSNRAFLLLVVAKR